MEESFAPTIRASIDTILEITTKLMHRTNLIWIMILSAVLLTPTVASTAPAMLNDDPSRPVGQISRDLGIPASVFRACFSHVHPAALSDHPTRERVHANKAVLLACLQQSNPRITNQSLDTVMDRYRPGGKEAQEPQR